MVSDTESASTKSDGVCVCECECVTDKKCKYCCVKVGDECEDVLEELRGSEENKVYKQKE